MGTVWRFFRSVFFMVVVLLGVVWGMVKGRWLIGGLAIALITLIVITAVTIANMNSLQGEYDQSLASLGSQYVNAIAQEKQNQTALIEAERVKYEFSLATTNKEWENKVKDLQFSYEFQLADLRKGMPQEAIPPVPIRSLSRDEIKGLVKTNFPNARYWGVLNDGDAVDSTKVQSLNNLIDRDTDLGKILAIREKLAMDRVPLVWTLNAQWNEKIYLLVQIGNTMGLIGVVDGKLATVSYPISEILIMAASF